MPYTSRIEHLLRPEVVQTLREHGIDPATLTLEPSAGWGGLTMDDLVGGLDDRSKSTETLARLACVGEIVAGIAHQQRNIMSGVLSFAQIGSMRATEPKTRDILEKIENESRRCLGLLTSLLGIARRKETAGAPSPTKEVNPNRVISDMASLVEHQMGMRGVKFEQSLSEDIGTVHCDQAALEEVVLNLLINAMHAAGNPGSVRVASEADADIRITVSDSGAGVPDAIRDRIFEPFFTTKAADQGTGLGLALSKKFVEGAGGSLNLISNPDEGAVFEIRLPRSPQEMA